MPSNFGENNAKQAHDYYTFHLFHWCSFTFISCEWGAGGKKEPYVEYLLGTL